ncbi:MAG: hypothetical protein MJZ49_08190 [Bacteroidales bacterium]|nr:hypothetical protein [Bacteroidales bacterium]
MLVFNSIAAEAIGHVHHDLCFFQGVVTVVFADLGADACVVGHEFPFPVSGVCSLGCRTSECLG